MRMMLMMFSFVLVTPQHRVTERQLAHCYRMMDECERVLVECARDAAPNIQRERTAFRAGWAGLQAKVLDGGPDLDTAWSQYCVLAHPQQPSICFREVK